MRYRYGLYNGTSKTKALCLQRKSIACCSNRKIKKLAISHSMRSMVTITVNWEHDNPYIVVI